MIVSLAVMCDAEPKLLIPGWCFMLTLMTIFYCWFGHQVALHVQGGGYGRVQAQQGGGNKREESVKVRE